MKEWFRERFVLYNRKLYWYYRITTRYYFNEYFGKNHIHKDYWSIGLGLSDKWFAFEELEYDGIYYTTVSVFHLAFFKGSEWSDDPVDIGEFDVVSD